MKIRNGFVSNSSSSSFIIAVKGGNSCPHCGRSDPNFLDEITKQSVVPAGRFGKTVIAEIGIEGILDSIRMEYDWKHNELKNIEKRMREIENDEWLIANVKISNHDIKVHEILRENVKSGKVIVIWKDEEALFLYNK